MTPATSKFLFSFTTHKSSGVTGGGQGAECPPETSEQESFADVSGKRGKEKGVKIEKKRRKIVKGKVEN